MWCVLIVSSEIKLYLRQWVNVWFAQLELRELMEEKEPSKKMRKKEGGGGAGGGPRNSETSAALLAILSTLSIFRRSLDYAT